MAVSFVAKGDPVFGTSSLSFTGTAKPDGSEGDVLLCIVGMKPSTANSGVIDTPSGTGWVPVGALGGSNVGGYSTTLGADTGNCRIAAFKKVATTTSEADFTVSLSISNSAWGIVLRFSRSTLPGWAIECVTAQDTSGGNVSLGFGAITNGIAAGDYVVAAMCVPTDAASFSAEAFSTTSITYGTVTEQADIASGTGNDVGGMVATAPVNSGTSTSTTTFTATGGGTTTNIRGPGLMIRLREFTPKLLQSLTDTFTGGTRDSAKWPTVFGTTAQANNRYELYDNIGTLRGAVDYTWAGSSFLGQIGPPGGIGAAITIAVNGTSTFLEAVVDAANNRCLWRYVIAGTENWADSVAGGYNATAHAWIRVRDDGAGTSSFDTSPDGLAWTNQFSRPTPSLLLDANFPQFVTNGDAGGTMSGTAWIDNVNNPPVVPGQMLPFFM